MLQEPTYLILVVLLDGAAHGYGIIRDVADVSGGAVQLRAGTLYGALDRLADEGLIEVDREATVNGRRRRYYRLTATGASVAEAETERRHRTAATAVIRLRRRTIRSLAPESA